MHSYTVSILNENDFEVKLLSRCWTIFDSLGPNRIVEGDGVIGVQPNISAGEEHIYSSGCDLTSQHGSMEGYYIFKRLDTGKLFKVRIPRFVLSPFYSLN